MNGFPSFNDPFFRMNLNEREIPHHVAIIMDGNGRWARERGLPRIEGHRKGADSVKEIVRVSGNLGIRHLTLYAFSVENWRRPREEIDSLMEMLETFLRDQRSELVKRKIRFHTIGRIEDLPAAVQAEIEKTLSATSTFDQWHLNLALNYGSRTEVVDAFRAYGKAATAGKEDPAECNWEKISRYLYTREIPDPDLIIRTSGETRLSNFLLLQSAYAEIYFSSILWPDFREAEFMKAIEHYRSRERRFGLTGDQIRQNRPSPSLTIP